VDAATSTIATVAGNGQQALNTAMTLGGSALSISLGGGYLALDPAGNLYIYSLCLVIKVDRTSGLTTAVAGTGQCRSGGDGDPATSAQFSYGNGGGLAVDASGNVYVGDAPGVARSTLPRASSRWLLAADHHPPMDMLY